MCEHLCTELVQSPEYTVLLLKVPRACMIGGFSERISASCADMSENIDLGKKSQFNQHLFWSFNNWNNIFPAH